MSINTGTLVEVDSGAHMKHTTGKELSETNNQQTSGQKNSTGEVAATQHNDE